MEADSDRQDENALSTLKVKQFLDQQLQILQYESQLLLRFKFENVTKMKNKPHPALLRTSYLSTKRGH
jgi:hypothetical protein